MKTLKQFIEESWNVQVSGVPGDAGHSYDKWGRKGGVEAWKKHVSTKHKGAKFTSSGERTHAHVGDTEVGYYSHFNNSSKTKD